MTAGDWRKILDQIKHKDAKRKKFLKHNKPKEREFGESTKSCEECGRFGGHISSYGLHLCRQCFREMAEKIGFKKYN